MLDDAFSIACALRLAPAALDLAALTTSFRLRRWRDISMRKLIEKSHRQTAPTWSISGMERPLNPECEYARVKQRCLMSKQKRTQVKLMRLRKQSSIVGDLILVNSKI